MASLHVPGEVTLLSKLGVALGAAKSRIDAALVVAMPPQRGREGVGLLAVRADVVAPALDRLAQHTHVAGHEQLALVPRRRQGDPLARDHLGRVLLGRLLLALALAQRSVAHQRGAHVERRVAVRAEVLHRRHPAVLQHRVPGAQPPELTRSAHRRRARHRHQHLFAPTAAATATCTCKQYIRLIGWLLFAHHSRRSSIYVTRVSHTQSP